MKRQPPRFLEPDGRSERHGRTVPPDHRGVAGAAVRRLEADR